MNPPSHSSWNAAEGIDHDTRASISTTLRHQRMQLKPLPSPAFLNVRQENRVNAQSVLPGQINEAAKLQNPSTPPVESYSPPDTSEFVDKTNIGDTLHGRLSSVMSNEDYVEKMDRRTSSIHSETSQQSFSQAGKRRPSVESLTDERTESLTNTMAKLAKGNLPDFSASQFLFESRKEKVAARWSTASWYASQEASRLRDEKTIAFQNSFENKRLPNLNSSFAESRKALSVKSSASNRSLKVVEPEPMPVRRSSSNPDLNAPPDKLTKNFVSFNKREDLPTLIPVEKRNCLHCLRSSRLQSHCEMILRSRFSIFVDTIAAYWILFAVDIGFLCGLHVTDYTYLYGVNFAFLLDLILMISILPDFVWFILKVSDQNVIYWSDIQAIFTCLRVVRILKAVFVTGRILKSLNQNFLGEYTNSTMQSNLYRRMKKYIFLCTIVVILVSLGGTLMRSPYEVEGISLKPSMKLLLTTVMTSKTAALPLIEQFVSEMSNQNLKLMYFSLGNDYTWGTPLSESDLGLFPKKFIEFNFTFDYDGFPTSVLVQTDVSLVSQGETLFRFISSLGFFVILLIMLLSLISLVRSQVVGPVMSSIEKLNEIAKDPLTPLRDESKKSKFLELVKIESALIKFGMLLQVAFGEAGSDIIRECITKDGLNYNKPGKVVQAFYGFCDIRRFTDLTEIMQADVVKLVNRIAHRVHSAALENFGAPNKNIGDAFLLIWKPKGQVAINTVADSALRTYIRIILENYSDPYLRQVAKSEAVQQRVPGYSNWLGFGLHYGW
eukprot:760947-Hanusia_phi.AAC.6